MEFNRAPGVSLLVCLMRWLTTCLWSGHIWTEWWWVQYLHTERRICQRCGWTQIQQTEQVSEDWMRNARRDRE